MDNFFIVFLEVKSFLISLLFKFKYKWVSGVGFCFFWMFFKILLKIEFVFLIVCFSLCNFCVVVEWMKIIGKFFGLKCLINIFVLNLVIILFIFVKIGW